MLLPTLRLVGGLFTWGGHATGERAEADAALFLALAGAAVGLAGRTESKRGGHVLLSVHHSLSGSLTSVLPYLPPHPQFFF